MFTRDELDLLVDAIDNKRQDIEDSQGVYTDEEYEEAMEMWAQLRHKVSGLKA